MKALANIFSKSGKKSKVTRFRKIQKLKDNLFKLIDIFLKAVNPVYWFIVANGIFITIKSQTVYKIFWGRGNFHKRILHITFAFLTISILLTGISSRLTSVNTIYGSLDNSNLTVGNIDLLQQGSNVQSVVLAQSKTNYRIFRHKVESGDSLESIAKKYQVTKETIKWSNRDKIDYHKENVNPGDELVIPEISGILYSVGSNDSLESILKNARGADRYEVLEINQLNRTNNEVVAGSFLFIPNATFDPPPQPLPQVVFTSFVPTSSGSLPTNVNVGALNGIAFVDPLSHPSCGGYAWNRGFTHSDYRYGHDGVDLGKNGGCPIRSVAAGKVTFAGWGSYGEGYNIRIDHGNGVTSSYYHGDGNIWVRAGDSVATGQEIMNMGCTGWCFGTHLHFILKINGVAIDPGPYVPYGRPY